MDSEEIFINLDDFILSERNIGDGGFGNVFSVIENATGQKFAAKELKSESYIMPKAQKLLIREITILSKLNHFAIVKYKGFSFISFFDRSKWQPTIFTEYVDNKSLDKALTDSRRGLASHEWDDTKKYIVLLGIAAAMKYLHAKEIAHRDLKPENILLDTKYYPKLCDFGLSGSLRERMTSNIGTKAYMAPEIISGEGNYGLKVDVYSFAILAFEIVTGELAYPSITDFNHRVNTRIINGTLRPRFPGYVNENMKNLIMRCWDSDPESRPSFDEILSILSQNCNDYHDNLDDDEIQYYLDQLSDCEQISNDSKKFNIEHYHDILLYLSKKNENQLNPLCCACMKGYYEIVEFLLSKNEIDVNSACISLYMYTVSSNVLYNFIHFFIKFCSLFYMISSNILRNFIHCFMKLCT